MTENTNFTEQNASLDENLYSALLNIYTKDRSDLILDIKQKIKTIDDFSDDCRAFIKEYYDKTPEEVEILIQALIDNLFGYSVITPLINDPEISDIKIHSWNNIIVKKLGKRYISDIKFKDEKTYQRFFQSVITRNNINASILNAITRFTDNETSPDAILRFTLVNHFLTTSETNEIIIRKIPKNFYSMDTLVEKEMMDDEIKDYLINRWKDGSILICGAVSSGKTTLLNALKEEIPHDKAILVIQQAEELTTRKDGSGHPDMVFLHSIEGTGEADLKYSLKELSIAGLTMDIDYFIIGEIKGDEAVYIINAGYTGQTCGATIHSNDASTAIDKLIDYALYTERYSKKELIHMMTCFKTVVFMKDFKVDDIVEVVGEDEEKHKLIYQHKKFDFLDKNREKVEE